jgi:hypothetical protein
LRRCSTKYFLLVSAAALLAAASSANAQEDPATKIPRANELTLLGLRPGKDTLAIAEHRLRTKPDAPTDDGTTEWSDACTGRAIKLEVDAKGVIQSVTISAIASDTGKCSGHRGKFIDDVDWKTGHGLRLGDSQDRVSELYGDANSTGPSVKGDRELELLYYAFDWAGSDVPQVMEILCARESGRVMEITLAYPSL